MPLAVTVAQEAIFEAFVGDNFDRALPHGHSFTANPLACAVGLASLALFEEEQTLARIARTNARHSAMLTELAARPDVTRPRVIGSILAFDVKDAGAYQSAASRALRDFYLSRGLNIRPLGQTVYLMPPYCITDEELTRAYAGMVEGLDRLASGALSAP
jgi:adenosylmethionine-8-amino-7-oxononanoate aminotransferase